MSNNNLEELVEVASLSLTPEQLKRLAQEIHDFRKTFLYAHYREHFKTLYSETVNQILEERLKGPETIYTREGWIGEARAAKLNDDWFEMLNAEITQAIRALEQ
jgi:hypothetical protein